MGEQSVKNIAQPIKVYRVLVGPAETGLPKPSAETPMPLVAGPGAYMVAVLPFDNLSSDPEQSYFSDGLTEDLITGLAGIEGLRVPARNTMFTYKGKAINIRRINSELGATHVVEGSVRKSGSRLRINVQLIDASNGNHSWAKRYDMELTDLFEIQDEIVHAIVTEIDVRLVRGEQARAWRRSTRNPEAQDLCRQAQIFIQHDPTLPNFQRALALLQKAQALDPKFVSAYVWEGHAHEMMVIRGFSPDPRSGLSLALARVEQGLTIDGLSGEARAAKGQLLFFMKQDELAEAEIQRAMDIDPNLPDSLFPLAMLRFRQRRYDEALSHFHRANELSGVNLHPWGIRLEALTLIALGKMKEARGFVEAYLGKGNEFVPLLGYRAAIASACGFTKEAESARAELLRLVPDYKSAAGIAMLNGLGAEERLIAWWKEHLSAAGIP